MSELFRNCIGSDGVQVKVRSFHVAGFAEDGEELLFRPCPRKHVFKRLLAQMPENVAKCFRPLKCLRISFSPVNTGESSFGKR